VALAFTLEGGCFATACVRELTRSDAPLYSPHLLRALGC
jgi:tRNA(Glu) U13 pseudouridine synthase TruD